MSEDTNVQEQDANVQDDSGYGIDDAEYTPETGDDTEGSEEAVTPDVGVQRLEAGPERHLSGPQAGRVIDLNDLVTRRRMYVVR